MATTKDQQLATLLLKLQEHYNRGGQLIDELTAIIEKEETPGQQAKRLLDYFVAHWNRAYAPETYVVNGKKDMATLKRLLTDALTVDEVAARIQSYFKMRNDTFFANARFSLPVFIASINRIPGAGAVKPRSDMSAEVQRTRNERAEQRGKVAPHGKA